MKFGETVNCGYFFDADNGLIGLGGTAPNFGSLNIWWTSDGGNSWTQSIAPGGSGRITSFFMKDALSGFASIYSNNSEYSVWETTDGGKSWNDFSQGNTDRAACIYATSKAIIKTLWFGNFGGSSTDGGRTYSEKFSGGQAGWSNGIDFADDFNGVVTMGPGGGSWYSHDGGVTWKKSLIFLPEAWSVHAVKSTQTFLALSEDNSGTPGRTLYWSQDGGMTWDIRNDTYFTYFRRQQGLTGHLGGVGNTLYVQSDTHTNKGLYRSDDLGLSWNPVGGPSSYRDTRFIVTGCNGEVVYAFDTSGGIWKTTDGGDNTLTGPANGKFLPILTDSLFISNTCFPAQGSITLLNPNCISYTIDSVSFSPDPYHEFSLDNITGSFTLYPNINGSIPVKFVTDSDVTRRTVVHVHGHFSDKIFDLVIDLTAQHNLIHGPLLALKEDSIFLSNKCQAARGYIGLINRNCDSLVIDSIGFLPDLYKEFSLDTARNGWNVLSNDSVGLPILFQSDSELTRQTTIHIHAHSKNRSIDTTIIVRAQHTTVGGPLMSFAFDSVYMETRYCQPIRRYIDLSNVNCNDLVIDSIIFTPKYPELTIDTAIQKNLLLAKFSSAGIPVFFQTDSNITRRTTMRIVAHSLGRTIDTTIILVAKHSTAPEPYLVTLKKTKAGDTVVIPVFLRITNDSFTIKHISFHISYDGDILTPASQSYLTIGTLSAISTVSIGPTERSGILVTIDLPKPITQDSDLTKPLINLRMGVTLSRYMSCPVRMDTFAILNTDPLPLCRIPVTEFVVDPGCGDSILTAYMLSGKMPGFLSVRPNPNSGSEVEAVISLPKQSILTIELLDAIGKLVKTISAGEQFSKGEHTLKFNTYSLPNGSYTLRIRSSEGNTTREVVILR